MPQFEVRALRTDAHGGQGLPYMEEGSPLNAERNAGLLVSPSGELIGELSQTAPSMQWHHARSGSSKSTAPSKTG